MNKLNSKLSKIILIIFCLLVIIFVTLTFAFYYIDNNKGEIKQKDQLADSKPESGSLCQPQIGTPPGVSVSEPLLQTLPIIATAVAVDSGVENENVYSAEFEVSAAFDDIVNFYEKNLINGGWISDQANRDSSSIFTAFSKNEKVATVEVFRTGKSNRLILTYYDFEKPE